MKRAGRYIGRTFFVLLTAIVLALVFLLGVILMLEYGPSETARDLFVKSAMESSAGKFLATGFLGQEKVDEIMQVDEEVETTEVTNTDLVQIVEREDEDTEVEDIEIIPVSGTTYKGYVALVHDPSRVSVGTCGSFGGVGKTVQTMADAAGATLAVNGGGFEDTNGSGTGGTPIGIVISEGELVWGDKNTNYQVIGLDADHKLIVGYMTGQEALDANIQYALSYGPILVVNGEIPDSVAGGSGLNPRSAIGQTADGTIILIVIDGRQPDSLGASFEDLAQLMLDYGAVNAANLDGGSSTTLYYNGEYLNHSSSLVGSRRIPTCILVE